MIRYTTGGENHDNAATRKILKKKLSLSLYLDSVLMTEQNERSVQQVHD